MESAHHQVLAPADPASFKTYPAYVGQPAVQGARTDIAWALANVFVILDLAWMRELEDALFVFKGIVNMAQPANDRVWMENAPVITSVRAKEVIAVIQWMSLAPNVFPIVLADALTASALAQTFVSAIQDTPRIAVSRVHKDVFQ